MPYSLPVTCISLSGIAGTDCIGDTRTFINDNFTRLGQELCNLFSNTITLSTTSTVQHTFTSSSRLLASDVRNNSIDTRHLIDNSVTTAKLSARAVTTDKIATSAVTTDKIALSAVTADRINLVTSLSSNGYQIMPGGLIMQWGTLVNVPLNQSFNQVTFPISFPTAALNVNATISRSSIISGTVAPLVRNLTTTGVQIAGDQDTDASTGDIYWLAIGY